MNGPSLVVPYCGQTQQTQIQVTASIAYKYIDWEEGPWAMIPYQSLYPPPTQSPGTAFLPPPIQKTALWDAQQIFPL